MQHTRSKDKVQRFEGSIRYEGRDLFVKAAILPARNAPHVGADSPRFMEPPRRAEVVYYSLHDIETGAEVTIDYCMDADDAAITDLIRQAYVLDCIAERLLREEVVA